MIDNEQDTPQTDLEAQGEAEKKQASIPQEADKPKDGAPADDFAPKQGETLEAYAARMRGEVTWRDRQIGRQHRKLKEGDEKLTRAQEIEAENQRLKQLAEAGAKKSRESEPADTQAPPRQPLSTPVGTPADLKAQARFEVQVERLGAELLEKHTDEWRSAHANFERVGGVTPEVLSAVLDTDDPAYVMLKLGKNMGEYQRILDLPEGRRRAALIKMGMEPAQAPPPKPDKKPSAAPAPRTDALPPGSAAPPEGGFDPDADCRVTADENMQYSPSADKYRSDTHDREWYRKRIEQKRNSRGRPWSVGR